MLSKDKVRENRKRPLQVLGLPGHFILQLLKLCATAEPLGKSVFTSLAVMIAAAFTGLFLGKLGAVLVIGVALIALVMQLLKILRAKPSSTHTRYQGIVLGWYVVLFVMAAPV